MRYIAVVMGCVLLCIIGWFFAFKRPTVVEGAFPFKVGMAAGYAPFVSIDEQGEYEGFDIDIAHALARQMGSTLVLQDLGSMTALFIALQQGSIDAIMWGLSITQERCEKVAMIHYQGGVTTSYSLIFWDAVPVSVRSIEDMSGMTVCVEPHSAQDAVLREYPFITPLYNEKVDDALLNIQYRKADAAFVEPAIAKKFKNKYPNTQVLEVPLRPAEYVHGIGIAIRKDRTALIENVRKAVESLKAAGSITALERKWDIPS